MFSSPTPDATETVLETFSDDDAIGSFSHDHQAANDENGEEEDAFAIDRAATGGVHWSKAEKTCQIGQR